MKDIKYDILKPNQIANHFKNNVELTKKSGLTKNLKNLIYKNIDIDNFYPRCYDISERNDFEDFMEDFKITKVISLLKEFQQDSRTNISNEKLNSCLEIIERKLQEWQTPLLQRKLITDIEWSIISEEDTVGYRKELERLERMNKIGFSNLSKKPNLNNKSETNNHYFLIEQVNLEKSEENKYSSKNIEELKVLTEDFLIRIRRIFPQYIMNGNKNIWIMKPSGLSRGRGIKCVNSLNEILFFIKKNSNQYMVQKYIENPMLVLGRKVFLSLFVFLFLFFLV